MELDLNEALRYLGAGSDPPEDLRQDMARTAEHLTRALRPRSVYRIYPLRFAPDGIALDEAGLTLPGASAAGMLAQCSHAALLACTLGEPFDALMRAEQARDMAGAVMLDACGSALVEAGCDAAQAELAARLPGKYLTDRFSPGYGDLPLDLQPALCAALDASRRIGLHVTGSLLLVPSKSVTAVIGLSDRPQAARIRGCAHCAMGETCALRKGGTTCVL